jgi:hypothetical protein
MVRRRRLGFAKEIEMARETEKLMVKLTVKLTVRQRPMVTGLARMMEIPMGWR